MKKINVMSAVVESFLLAFKNIPSFIGCAVLWVLTIWIPYVNIGTTIAIMTLPIELSKGTMINPLSIFAAKYRKKMGDYFIYQVLANMGIFFCSLFMFIPGMVLSVAWSMGLYITIEWDKNPIEALRLSNNITYGNKWRIFFTKALVSGIIGTILFWIFVYMANSTTASFGTFLMLLLLLVIYICCSIAVNAVIWKKLKENCNE